MGVSSRFADIIKANLNALMDRAEDPEKMLTLIIDDMEDALGDIRRVAAQHIAEQKQLERTVQSLNKNIAHWQQNAELAISKGRDDLAKSALQEKYALGQELDAVTTAQETLEEQLAQLRIDAEQLASKLNEARTKRDSLHRRLNIVEQRLRVKSTTEQQKLAAVTVRFDEYVRRIDNLEAKVESYDLGSSSRDLQQQFEQWQQNEKVEQELSALKQKAS